jgi:hypothetical protein
MQIEVTETPMRAYRLPSFNLRWSGIFAGLVVGIAVNLVLMLLGAAAGLAVFNVGDSPAGIPLAVAIWNTLCMVLAAFAGGYVAARSAGMRRASDGVLHGAVAWGATMVLSALLATSATGLALGSLFTTSPREAPEAIASLNLNDRQEAARTLEQRLGLTPEQANRAVDQALALSGREEEVSPANREAAEQGLRAASVASGWLSGAIVLSLLAAMGGGVLGAHGAQRLAGAQRRRAMMKRRPQTTPPPEVQVRVPAE